jgi:hypothetical protein
MGPDERGAVRLRDRAGTEVRNQHGAVHSVDVTDFRRSGLSRFSQTAIWQQEEMPDDADCRVR